MQKVITHLIMQLGLALFIHDQAWAYGYIESIKKMWDYVILNPQADLGAVWGHLKALDIYEFPPDLDALEHGCKLGRKQILDAFPPNSEASMVDPMGARADPNAPEVEPITPEVGCS